MTGAETSRTARSVDAALAATADYLAAPGPETASAAVAAISRHPDHALEVDFQVRARRLLDRGDDAAVVTLFGQHLPSVLLSPGAHLTLATAYEQLGDKVQAEREREVAVRSVEAIAASGDGTPDRPWMVVRVGDEYDFRAAQGHRVIGQRVVPGAAGRSWVDELTCDDGSVRCFALVSPTPEPGA